MLGVAEVDVHGGFFELGGHSLSAMRLVSLIEQYFCVRLLVALLFQHPPMAALAEVLRRRALDALNHNIPAISSERLRAEDSSW